MKKQWYKITNANEVYYSPFKEKKTASFHIENRTPTPEEICDKVNSLDGCTYMESGWFIHSTEDSRFPLVKLPPGVYRHRHNPGLEGLVPFDLREDEYVHLDESFAEIQKDLEEFYNAKGFFDDVGSLYKIGVLLYGPPGEGKSTVIRQILKESVPKDSVIIFVNGDLFSEEFIDCMKESLDGRLKVIIFEELTSAIAQYRSLEKMLNFLDGESSMAGQVVLATTNYPENLPGNLVDRPSRFDKLIKFDNPNTEARTKILTHYLGRPPEDIEVSKSKDMSIAAIKELVTLMRVSKLTFEQALKKMSDRKALIKKNFAEAKSKVGFGGYD